jgi:hypothetical protein
MFQVHNGLLQILMILTSPVSGPRLRSWKRPKIYLAIEVEMAYQIGHKNEGTFSMPTTKRSSPLESLLICSASSFTLAVPLSENKMSTSE